jgi:sialidase-1
MYSEYRNMKAGLHAFRSFLLVSCLLLAGGRGMASDTTIRHVFTAGEGGVHTYRIPAMVLSPKGHVLVFAEARKESISDASPTDMVLRRSLDGGRSWQPIQTLVRGAGTDAIMNPVALVDRKRHRVLLVYCLTNRKERGEHRRHFLITSRDDGLSWSDPVEIGSRMKGYDDTFVPGPGAGIQMRNGRLVVPGYTSEEHPDFKKEQGMHSRVVFSDNGGRTWRMGAPVDIHTNESQVVELQDGRLMLNMRQGMGQGCRAVAVSGDGGIRWDSVWYDRQLNESPCQASLLTHSLPGKDGSGILVFANPDNAGSAFGLEDRTKMTVRLSYDEGANWKVRKRIHAGPSSYSGLVRFPDGDIGIVFEGGEKHRREWIRFARLPMNWLTAE